MGISSHPTDVEGWSTGKDGVFLYWDTDRAKPTDSVLVSEAGLRGFVPLPTRRLFACAGRDGTAYIIERDSRQIIQRLIVENQPLFSIATAADESTLWIGGQSGWVYAWNVEDWTLRTAWQAHARAVNAIALHPAGQLIATASRDKQIHLWDARSGKRLLTLAGHQRSVNALQWVDEGVLASAGDDGVIKVWHLEA
jgi:WD40 repeat protein